jgi:hypothetical protein
MDGTCSTREEIGNAHQILVIKFNGRKSPRRPKSS